MTVLTRAASGARISRPARSRRGRRSSAPARVARVGAPGQRPPLTGRGERRSRRPRRKGVFARFVMGALFLFGLVFTGLATTSTTAHAELINIPCSIVPTFYNAIPQREEIKAAFGTTPTRLHGYDDVYREIAEIEEM